MINTALGNDNPYYQKVFAAAADTDMLLLLLTFFTLPLSVSKSEIINLF